VIRTLIQPGDEAFEYRFKIPANESPGLYWYHPHPHGFSEPQVLGGASGALIVEGIEQAAPVVAGLPERVLVLRDQLKEGVAEDPSKVDRDELYISSLDLSLNYVPIKYPLYKPALMIVRPAQREFWRVLNASADTFFNLRLLYRTTPELQVAQPMQMIAIDGVPVGADFASVERTSILLPPGSRAEFLMTTPPAGMYAQFQTQRYNNGPYGDTASYRVLAIIRSQADAPAAPGTVPPAQIQGPPRFAGLTSLDPARQRTLYFSEKFDDPAHPKQNVSYFLTAGDATPKVFDMNFTKPDLTAIQGTTEDWMIENRAEESHVFHIHQLHFQLLERDGKPVEESALRDTIDLPFWDGKSTSYPRVKIRMDFRDPNIIGTFLYHCHILEHEDGGMMGSIQVVAPATGTSRKLRRPESKK
jgi:FtsP/CotA-like multicopper oxidase with cupredoxin domain